MTHILAIDTSGPSLSVALTRDGKLVYECTQQNGLTHSDSLMPLIDAALRAGRLAPADVDLFACVTGPGSFTGVRIGVVTVRALSHVTGRPCLGVSALEALAAGALFFDGLVCPMQDARAGQVYAAGFLRGSQALPDAALPLSDFLAQAASYGRCCFVGDGVVAHRAAIEAQMGENAAFPPADRMVIHAADVARLAAARIDHAHGWQALRPYYLRAPQAERERLAREAGAHA